MAEVLFKGSKTQTTGNLPTVGSKLPDFLLTKTDLSDINWASLKGKKILFNIFPSVDTSVCAASVRRFNVEAAQFSNTEVLCVSRDLPFAHSRFCGAEGIDKVTSVSEMRNRSFGKMFGVEILDGPLAGLLARSIVIADAEGKVVYTQLVPEITHEPDYAPAVEALKKLN